MRVLFLGDASPSGFGTVSFDLGLAMLDIGLDVRFLSQNEVGFVPPPFDSRMIDLAFWEYNVTEEGVTGVRSLIGDIVDGTNPTLLMMNGEPWGEWVPETIILLGDFYAVRILDSRFGASFRKVPTFHYCPVEGVDLPPLWSRMWSDIKPVAMSRFGQEQIALVTGVIPPLAYHGVDTDVFRPVSASEPLSVPKYDQPDSEMIQLRSKEACRLFFGWDPKRRYILRTDRLMPRKRYDALVRAIAPVLADRPDVTMILHCRAQDQGGMIFEAISKLPAENRQQVLVTNKTGLPRAVLVAMYNAADLYVSTSAEGFGLTIAEAIACAIPAVGMDYSAVPEVIGPAGVVIPPAFLYDNEYGHRWAQPDEEKFGSAVAWFLDHPQRARAIGAEGPKHVKASFQWSNAAQVFADLLSGTENARRDDLPPESEDFTFTPLQPVSDRPMVLA